VVGPFTRLFDDDDFNSNDTPDDLDGDTTEDVAAPDQTLMRSSADPPREVTGTIPGGGVTTPVAGQCRVNVDTTLPGAANDFQDGQIYVGTTLYRVVSNTDNAGNDTVDIEQVLGGCPAAGSAFSLHSAGNVFAPAYVQPAYDVGDGNGAVAFVLNTPDGAGEEALLLATYDFDTVAVEASDIFWTVYLLGAYQMQTEEDCDRDSDENCTAGQVDDLNGQGVSVFLESAREFEVTGPGDGPSGVTVHEMGHLFNSVHPDGELMSSEGASKKFSDTTVVRIRVIDHP
jgi:hypothetical protein